MERIKFFNISDLSSGGMIKKIEELVMNSTFYKVLEINDALEAYNITRFIDDYIELPNWDDEFKRKCKEFNKDLKQSVGKFFSSIDNDNILEIMKSLELNYREDFFCLFAKFNLQDRISWSVLKEALNQKIIHTSLLLRNEKIVNRYSTEIRQELLSDPGNAELLFYNLTADLTDIDNKYILPQTINNKDVYNLLLDYVNSPHPNISYLRHIKNYRNGNSKYVIPKELQYKAQLRLADLEKEIFTANNTAIKISVEISFRKIDTLLKEEFNGLNFRLTYNSDWIEKNNSHQAILGNFIKLFQYTNESFQINLFSKPNEGSVIERAISSNLKSDYDANTVFIIKNMIADLQLLAYSKKLREQNIEIESTLEWYYREYILEKYGVESFQISLLKNHKDYYEMCKSIVPEIESVAKQYLVLIEKGQIDHQYISAVNPTVNYQYIPSRIKLKYAYPSSEDISNIIFLLYSNQSLLNYIPKYGNTKENFANIILNKRLNIEDFEKYQAPRVRFLIDKNILEVNELNGELNFVDIHKILLLEKIFDYGFLSVQNYSSEYKDIISSLISDGDLTTYDRLLSKEEASYFNYYLNSSEFGNSRDLRNKYAHGSSDMRGEINEQDYYSLLKILILLTLKIENDLHLSRSIEQHNE